MGKFLDVTDITVTLRDNYTVPLSLCINDGCIAAVQFTEGDHPDGYVICFEHPQGDISLWFDRPTNAEFYEFDPGCLQSDYASNRRIVYVACGFDASDDPPWAEVDESGIALRSQEAQMAMLDWLQAAVSDDLVEGLADELSEFAPGLAIWEGMDESECKRFGLRRVNRGGPASSVPAVTFGGSVFEFNLFLMEKNLPYRIVQKSD